MKERNVMFTETDFRILDSYKSVLDGLAAYLGDGYEIVLHSLHDLDHSVIKIINGHYTGRREGFPITDLALSMLAKIEERPDTNCITYFNRNQKGEPLKSATIVIRNHSRMAIGLLCINFDDSRYRAISDHILKLCHPDLFVTDVLAQPLPESEDDISARSSPEKFRNSADAVALDAINRELERMGVTPEQLTPEKRLQVIAALEAGGIFLLKGAIKSTAAALGCSTASIYRYLSQITPSD